MAAKCVLMWSMWSILLQDELGMCPARLKSNWMDGLGVVLRASSGFPASYLTCGSSIIQVILASFKYLLEHKVFEIFSFINNSSSNNCLPNVFIQEIIIAKSKKLKKNCQFFSSFMVLAIMISWMIHMVDNYCLNYCI